MPSLIELGDHFDDLKYPNWQKPVQEALIELDQSKLKERIAAAEAAISQRLEFISQGPDHHAERDAMDHALSNLRVVMKESSNLADSER